MFFPSSTSDFFWSKQELPINDLNNHLKKRVPRNNQLTNITHELVIKLLLFTYSKIWVNRNGKSKYGLAFS
ncbi:hypothetical protein RIR_jg38415.t1 [Rhizophagus irregularis DAOM 181602=DAOM 197198]|nr:hypothetical protein RIR_jg38415.t1 [Rhizophagus irregularis DAOM 181602=DAOM 197198]